MTVVAVCSFKGAPGATTTALALTAAIAAHGDRPALLVEADAAGGDLAALTGRPLDPGLASLAASSRHEAIRPEVAIHVQTLPAGGGVLLASTDPTEVAANMTTLARRLPDAVQSAGYDAVVDAGRVHPSSPAVPLIERADAAVVCITATVPAVEAVAVRRGWLTELLGGRGGLVLIGDSTYDDAEITGAAGLPVVGRLPWDRRAVAALVGGPGPSPARSHLVRAARSLHDALTMQLIGALA